MDKCPYQRTIRGGDESVEVCDLVDKWCLLMYYDECEEYEKIKREEEEENNG